MACIRTIEPHFLHSSSMSKTSLGARRRRTFDPTPSRLPFEADQVREDFA